MMMTFIKTFRFTSFRLEFSLPSLPWRKLSLLYFSKIAEISIFFVLRINYFSSRKPHDQYYRILVFRGTFENSTLKDTVSKPAGI